MDIVHLGIIMDGNRRWAKKRSRPSFEGHKAGADKVKEVIRWCAKRGIKYLTFYTFSTENWLRSEAEVDFIFKLVELFLRANLGEIQKENLGEIQKEGGRLRFLGDRKSLPFSLREMIAEAELLTRDNQRINVNALLNYGGRADIVQAVRQIVEEGISSEEISEEKISSRLYTAGQPDPDLIIRTSGEMRLSNFLTWQSAYSELYFCQKHWPDFDEQDLDDALTEYALRQRRMGG